MRPFVFSNGQLDDAQRMCGSPDHPMADGFVGEMTRDLPQLPRQSPHV
jgi:hypothetical protein